MRKEAELQLRLCEWLQDTYPAVMFHSDLSSGMALSPGQATFNKRLQFTKGMPDLYIFEARGGWHGLFIELKHESSMQIKRDGTLGDEKHIVEQRTVHTWFVDRGYLATFSIGLEASKQLIHDYLQHKLVKED